MEKIIDFFKLIFVIVLVTACSCQYNKKDVMQKIDKNDSLIQKKTFELKTNLKNKLYYEAVFDSRDNSVINTYFLIMEKKFSMPKFFSNQNSEYNYSLFPLYATSNLIVSKSYEYDDFTMILIRGENPFCNGMNCTSYYLHLVCIDSNEKIKLNLVYFLDSKEHRFEDLELNYFIEKKIIQIYSGDKILFVESFGKR